LASITQSSLRVNRKGVAAFDIAAVARVHLVVGAAAALVFDQALALVDRQRGEHAVAVDGGLAGGDLLRHRCGAAWGRAIVPS